ncbi:hypothetical protein RJT34_04142 [Clitoria ternatea]|uniref:Large ribosomal subunit protein bL32m n=1 Tax=Clitoria ternatea TaxID=43366 RepID=A0AAN9KMY1_CLITE
MRPCFLFSVSQRKPSLHLSLSHPRKEPRAAVVLLRRCHVYAVVSHPHRRRPPLLVSLLGARPAMAVRLTISRSTGRKLGSVLGFNRWIRSVPQSPPLAGSIDLGARSLQPVLPEFSCPSFSFGGSMELMGVPKRKVSPHRRGIRNGPKALKPVPVLVLCKSCGRVRLPHFFCCGGKPNTGNTGKQNGSTS